MTLLFTDDKQNVIIDGEFVYDIDTFISFYGNDALPWEMKGEGMFSYYDILLDLLDAIGSFAHARKLLKNAKKGDNPKVNEVRDMYYKSTKNLEQKVLERKQVCWGKIKLLNEEGVKNSFSPLSVEEQRNLLNFLYDKRRRNYFRQIVRRFYLRRELHSVVEIYERCLSVQSP